MDSTAQDLKVRAKPKALNHQPKTNQIPFRIKDVGPKAPLFESLDH